MEDIHLFHGQLLNEESGKVEDAKRSGRKGRWGKLSAKAATNTFDFTRVL